ncbi:hypothetical protein BH11ARM2_BH11ARM2_13220 [soil metagenome]
MILPLLALLAAPSQASLVLSADSVAPGQTFTAAIRIKMDAGWHVYWKNPGDSGSAPTVKWKLPAGWRIGQLRWPVPTRHVTPDGTDYIYEDEVLLLADITAPSVGSRPSLPDQSEVAVPVAPQATMKADVSYLVCQEACMPASASVSAVIRVGSEKPSKDADRIAEVARSIPARIIDGWKAKATPTGVMLTRTDGDVIEKGTLFLPSETGILEHADAGTLSSDGKTLTLKRSPYASANPKRLRGLILLPNNVGKDIDIPVSP